MARHFVGPANDSRIGGGLEMLLEAARILPPSWLSENNRPLWCDPITLPGQKCRLCDAEEALASALHLFTIEPIAFWEIQAFLARRLGEEFLIPGQDATVIIGDTEAQVRLTVEEAWRIAIFGSIE
jgi:hypothetical protein